MDLIKHKIDQSMERFLNIIIIKYFLKDKQKHHFLLPLAQRTKPATPIPNPTVTNAKENNVSNCTCVNFDFTYSINENN